jgi:hypothetical protein
VDESIVEGLLASPQPAIRWLVRSRILGEPADDDRAAIPATGMVRRMLAGVGSRPYAKWQGAHWVLAALAEIGHPPGSADLIPLREQVLPEWLDNYFERLLNGRYRAHASEQGYALWYLTKLGLSDERCERLAELLLKWQWPDGGWNCDRNPEASTSSFMETLLPMRGLWLHGTKESKAAARAAAEVFLSGISPGCISRCIGTTTFSAGSRRWARWGCSAIRAAPTRWRCWSRRGSRTAGRRRPGTTAPIRRTPIGAAPAPGGPIRGSPSTR